MTPNNKRSSYELILANDGAGAEMSNKKLRTNHNTATATTTTTGADTLYIIIYIYILEERKKMKK